MLIFFYLTVALLIIYGILIAFYNYAWNKIPTFTQAALTNWEGKKKITVIVPARNEELTITRCLNSLSKQNYPEELLEIIIVNDHSTDKTEELVRNYPSTNITLVNLSDYTDGKPLNSYKKKAIEVAISIASGDLIVTTDADCTAQPGWIKRLAMYHQLTNAALLAAPVKIEHTKSLLSIFQAIDFLTLQGITGASVSSKFHSMCNGANLAYEKKVFIEVEGFKNIDNIASGDDMLLMHKIVTRYPERFFFVKERDAIVSTEAAPSWRAFLNQRIRWASKADKYNDKRIFPVLLMVYMLNVFILIFFLAGLWNSSWLFFFLILVVSKIFVEYGFVRNISKFFNQQNLMIYFPFLQPLHIIYTIIAGWLGKFGSYEWKSRKVK
jgi:cellulose synthase/poly-beta-1,6-N-acetylglucosamine synthase-like glycosyltransferase